MSIIYHTHQEEDKQIWEEFRPKLEALSTMEEAYVLVKESPPPDSPGRRFYMNLDFFIRSFRVPDGSSYREKQCYLNFIRRLDEAGELKPGVMTQVEEELDRAMDQQGPY